MTAEEMSRDTGQTFDAGAAAGRVMIVDDNRDAAETLSALLQLDGSRIEVAYSGSEAIDKGAKFLPQLVLLDIGMPGMDGYRTCRAVRACDWGSKAMIVAVTGWGQETDRRMSREAGFDGHLVKPVDYAALKDLLRRATQGS
jgi:CheY-like chemotaxis protein